MTSYDMAYDIAQKAHAGQKDKGGRDYFNHPLAVAQAMETEEEQVVALLHDVVEDTPLTLDDLRRSGFSPAVLSALDVLTHRSNEAYDSYIQRIRTNPLARKVKLSDLKHNMDLSRIQQPGAKDYARLDKYERAISYLQA